VSTAIGTPAITGGNGGGVVTGIQVDGAGLSSGTGVCAFGGNSQTGMFIGQSNSFNMAVINWCLGVAWSPVILDNYGTHYNLVCIGSGNICAANQGSNTFTPTEIVNGQFNSNTIGLKINTPLNSSHSYFYGNSFGVNLANNAAVWHSTGDSFYQTGTLTGAANVLAQNASLSFINDCEASTVAGNTVFQTANTAVIHVRGCHINAAATQFWADSHTQPGGPIYDDGGNVIIGSTSSDAIPTASHGIWGIGTGAATAATTLFLVGPTATTNAFTNTTATTVSGVVPFTGTLSDLVCTFTTAGLATDTVTVQTAPLSTGTFTASTITVTNLTTTSVSDHTHTVSVTQGQPVQFKFTTGAADTLAGAQCRVTLH